MGTSWTVTATNAGDLNGDQKFKASSYDDPFDSGDKVADQQAYDAVAWLADGLLASGNVNNATA